MIPFLAVGSFLKRIPRGLWIVLAVVAILGLGTCAHKRSVKKFGEERFAAGVKYEGDRIAKKAAEIKAKADKLTGQISKALKEKNDAQNRAIARSADDLRVSGPGKAACPGHPGVAASPGGPVAPGGAGNAAGPQVPAGEWAAVPWPWLVDRGEQCDLNRSEVLTWREWYAKQSEAWKKLSE